MATLLQKLEVNLCWMFVVHSQSYCFVLRLETMKSVLIFGSFLSSNALKLLFFGVVINYSAFNILFLSTVFYGP